MSHGTCHCHYCTAQRYHGPANSTFRAAPQEVSCASCGRRGKADQDNCEGCAAPLGVRVVKPL